MSPRPWAPSARSEPAFFHFSEKNLDVVSYVDDILTAGPQDSADWFYNDAAQRLLIKHLGEVHSDGKSIPFLGRVL